MLQRRVLCHAFPEYVKESVYEIDWKPYESWDHIKVGDRIRIVKPDDKPKSHYTYMKRDFICRPCKEKGYEGVVKSLSGDECSPGHDCIVKLDNNEEAKEWCEWYLNEEDELLVPKSRPNGCVAHWEELEHVVYKRTDREVPL